jgi:hypothetical protein
MNLPLFFDCCRAFRLRMSFQAFLLRHIAYPVVGDVDGHLEARRREQSNLPHAFRQLPLPLRVKPRLCCRPFHWSTRPSVINIAPQKKGAHSSAGMRALLVSVQDRLPRCLPISSATRLSFHSGPVALRHQITLVLPVRRTSLLYKRRTAVGCYSLRHSITTPCRHKKRSLLIA